MAARTKVSPETLEKIVNALRIGNTRRAAAEAAGISHTTFYEWLKTKPDIADTLTRAESECEVRHVATLAKAANGYPTGSKRTKTNTYEKTVVDGSGKPIPGPDGSPLREIITETETILLESSEFDWKASLEWLKRRRRPDWGDSLDIRKLDDETLLRLLEEGGEQQPNDKANEPATTGKAGS